MMGRRAGGGEGEGSEGSTPDPLLARTPCAPPAPTVAPALPRPAAGCCMCETAGAERGLCMAAAWCIAHRSFEERRRRPRPAAPAPPSPLPPRPGMLMGALLCRAPLPALPHGEPVPPASLSASSSATAAAPAVVNARGRGPPLEGLLPRILGRPTGMPAEPAVPPEAARGGLASGGLPLGDPTRYRPAEVDSVRSMAGSDTCGGSAPHHTTATSSMPRQPANTHIRDRAEASRRRCGCRHGGRKAAHDKQVVSPPPLQATWPLHARAPSCTRKPPPLTACGAEP